MPDKKARIIEKLRKALHDLLGNKKYDWKRESESICEAASSLMETVQEYIEGSAEESAVKLLYKKYVELHKV